MFVHPRCTNSGLRRTRGDLPESVCVPESPRGLAAVCDCSGFTITNYVRFFFANCQAPYFIRPDYICGRLAFPLFGPPG